MLVKVGESFKQCNRYIIINDIFIKVHIYSRYAYDFNNKKCIYIPIYFVLLSKYSFTCPVMPTT